MPECVCPCLTGLPAMSSTTVDRNNFRWSDESTSADGTETDRAWYMNHAPEPNSAFDSDSCGMPLTESSPLCGCLLCSLAMRFIARSNRSRTSSIDPGEASVAPFMTRTQLHANQNTSELNCSTSTMCVRYLASVLTNCRWISAACSAGPANVDGLADARLLSG